MKSGEIVEAREWPHPSFHPLNYSAAKVLDLFNTRMKSRLQRSPWRGDRLRLDDSRHRPHCSRSLLLNGQPGAANTVERNRPIPGLGPTGMRRSVEHPPKG
jgi:hypothetical protein